MVICRANRPAPELEAIIGYFVNPVALRTQIDGSCTFREAVQRVRETVVGAQANAEVCPLVNSITPHLTDYTDAGARRCAHV